MCVLFLEDTLLSVAYSTYLLWFPLSHFVHFLSYQIKKKKKRRNEHKNSTLISRVTRLLRARLIKPTCNYSTRIYVLARLPDTALYAEYPRRRDAVKRDPQAETCHRRGIFYRSERTLLRSILSSNDIVDVQYQYGGSHGVALHSVRSPRLRNVQDHLVSITLTRRVQRGIPSLYFSFTRLSLTSSDVRHVFFLRQPSITICLR